MIDIQVLYQDTNQQIALQFQQDQTYLLFDYDCLKKLIVKQFNYSISSKKCIQLSLVGVYPQLPNLITPILCNQNLKYLMQHILEKANKIKMIMNSSINLQKKADRKNEIAIQFDSDGSVDSVQNQKIASSIPKNGKYFGQDIVRCAFCSKSNQDKESIKLLGAFYGPFQQNQYVHYLCAIWCSPTYIDDNTDSMLGLKQALSSIRFKCHYCQQKGAGLKCHDPTNKCKIRTHYECSLQKCHLNWQTYTFLCHKCRKNDVKFGKLFPQEIKYQQ